MDITKYGRGGGERSKPVQLKKNGGFYESDSGGKYVARVTLLKVIDGKEIPAEGSFELDDFYGQRVAYLDYPSITNFYKKHWSTPMVVSDTEWGKNKDK